MVTKKEDPDKNKVYLRIKNPYQPLFSDKCLLWLAGTFAAAGHPLSAVTGPVVPREDEILLTNLAPPISAPSGSGSTLRITSSADRVNRLMLALGYFYGRSRFFHTAATGGGNPAAQKIIGFLKKPFQPRFAPVHPAQAARGPEAQDSADSVPPGRRIVLRINVDWDDKGFANLERLCERLALKPTLAIAGSEIAGRERLVRSFAERSRASIASHSLSHYVVLSSCGRRRRREEISDNHRLLEDLFGKEVRGFVAPYGKYNKQTFELLEETGYRWFIRSWTPHPLPLAGFGLADLGVSFFFNPGWREKLSERLVFSDLALQLHLRDLATFSEELERCFREFRARGISIIDCDTYYNQTCARLQQ